MLLPLILFSTLLQPNEAVSFASLVREAGDIGRLAKWPEPAFEALHASSYNRDSKSRDLLGWFADSDGTGFIRTEGEGKSREWVMMEHQGPGCITKIWTPFFYYDFNDRVGPNVRIYLDGSKTPVFDESLINLVCGKGSVNAPWAEYSARAGNLYLPIPFAKSAKITMEGRPSFYFNIDYRAYPKGTPVNTFQAKDLAASHELLADVGKSLRLDRPRHQSQTMSIPAGKTVTIPLPKGSHAVDDIQFRIIGGDKDSKLFRTTVFTAKFDGEESIWCPLGDFFCSADSIHPFSTRSRTVDRSGNMRCFWLMPYQSNGKIELRNLASHPVQIETYVHTRRWTWDARSMHFYARWRSDDIVPGFPFSDWNFVDVSGKGVYVGDSWTVLNIRKDSWWGEGDEKIYVDDAWDKGFPTHFGTGSEDYYGWAGGVYPVKEDQFSAPFLANVSVGGLDGHTMGYNILTRNRGLDAIPFTKRLRFDMESSFGTDMREPWNLLGYSVVTFWYATPGAIHNRPSNATGATRPIVSVSQLQELSDSIRKRGH